jgi:hypothetical protein
MNALTRRILTLRAVRDLTHSEQALETPLQMLMQTSRIQVAVTAGLAAADNEIEALQAYLTYRSKVLRGEELSNCKPCSVE